MLDGARKQAVDVSPNYRYQILRVMWKAHPWLTIGTAVTGVISGFAGIAVIDTINSAIHNAAGRTHLLWPFIGLTIASIIFGAGSALFPAYASREIITSLRMALCRKILTTPLEEIDRRGVANVLTLLTRDIPQLAQTLLLLPSVLVQSTIFIFGIAYLAYLSWIAFALTLGAILVGVSLYGFFLRRAMFFSRKVRGEFTAFNEHTHGLLFGIKELILNSERRRWFKRAAIDHSSKKVANYNFIEHLWFTGGQNVSQISYSILLGALIFGAASAELIAPATLIACVLTILYIIGPLSMLVGAVPALGEGSIACERLAEFGLPMQDKDKNLLERQHFGREPALETWKSIEFRDVRIKYTGSVLSNGFELGPISLKLIPGELIFIVGGNGSGKSTLAKVLTGLYSANEGQILLDDKIIDETNKESYRSLFSAVFADFHIFDRIIGPDPEKHQAAIAQEYLVSLGLAGKIQITRKKLSTTTALSNGQRKRLALLCAYMEDRPILVLDEWAADQDPSFKGFFYEKLLPDLKKSGKCVLIITHDDRYFEVADRLIKLADGLIVSDIRLHPYRDLEI